MMTHDGVAPARGTSSALLIVRLAKGAKNSGADNSGEPTKNPSICRTRCFSEQYYIAVFKWRCVFHTHTFSVKLIIHANRLPCLLSIIPG
jgi:hypothetical protein